MKKDVLYHHGNRNTHRCTAKTRRCYVNTLWMQTSVIHSLLGLRSLVLKTYALTTDHCMAVAAKIARREMQVPLAISHGGQAWESCDCCAPSETTASTAGLWIVWEASIGCVGRAGWAMQSTISAVFCLQCTQGGSCISEITFGSCRGYRQFSYKHSESVRGFQVNNLGIYCTIYNLH